MGTIHALHRKLEKVKRLSEPSPLPKTIFVIFLPRPVDISGPEEWHFSVLGIPPALNLAYLALES